MTWAALFRRASRIAVLPALLLLARNPSLAADDLFLSKITLPPGFHISVYARVPDARSLTLSPSGTVYVGNRSGGSVFAVLPPKSGRGPQVLTIASGLRSPNGVAFKDGDLYVAEISRVLRFPSIERDLAHPPKPVVVSDRFPTDGAHGWKFIAFGPDGDLYVPVGAPCNVCDPQNPIYASITRLSPGKSEPEVFARGVRNTVGFDWDPSTRALYFTDNGRDLLGDDMPPDELNKADRPGLHFGFPYCHGGDIPDPQFGAGHPCSRYVKPEINLGAHVAALGARFYGGSQFPPAYRGRLFIAEHGSWNRTRKVGYRVVTVVFENGKAVRQEPFAQGWLQNEDVWGRPVDVLVMPDGALLVSDDFSGTLYRITYRP